MSKSNSETTEAPFATKAPVAPAQPAADEERRPVTIRLTKAELKSLKRSALDLDVTPSDLARAHVLRGLGLPV